MFEDETVLRTEAGDAVIENDGARNGAALEGQVAAEKTRADDN